MKDFLRKLIANKQAQRNNLNTALIESDNKEERAAIGETLKQLAAEIAEAEAQLAKVEEEENNTENNNNDERKLTPLASYGMATTKKKEELNGVDKRSTMEYRTAFKDFVQRGIPSNILEKRANAEGVSSDLGILLPTTIVKEIIKGVDKVYGAIASKVKHTSLKGGVKYPIGAFSANVVWQGTAGTDSEHGVSETQNAGSITSYVEFTYHVGEVRIAQSLLESVLAVDEFEQEIVNAILEAYAKDREVMIFDGNGVKQPTGIFTNVAAGLQRIDSGNIIEFSPNDMKDWKQWQTKLFAKIPLGMRKLRPEFVMTANTFEANIETLEDSNGQPVARQIYNPITGDESASFKGRFVQFVEEGTSIKNFDDAEAGQYFGMYWVPEKAYAINGNLEFSFRKYFDETTNQYITKALFVYDGKILDPKYIYLLKKVANA